MVATTQSSEGLSGAPVLVGSRRTIQRVLHRFLLRKYLASRAFLSEFRIQLGLHRRTNKFTSSNKTSS